MLTPERFRRVVAAVRAGNSRNIAAKSVGVSTAGLMLWIRRGKEAQELKPCPESEKIFLKLVEAINRAEATAARMAMQQIQRGMRTDWKAAAWWLQKHYPHLYADDARILKEAMRMLDIIQRKLERQGQTLPLNGHHDHPLKVVTPGPEDGDDAAGAGDGEGI